MTISEKINRTKTNLVSIPMQPSCRLCHYAGFSNLCTYSLGGECPYISLKKSLSKGNSKSS